MYSSGNVDCKNIPR